MNPNDVEFAIKMLAEVLGNDSDIMIIARNGDVNAVAHYGNTDNLSRTIFEVMHRKDATSNILIGMMQELGHNLMLNKTVPSQKFQKVIFDIIND